MLYRFLEVPGCHSSALHNREFHHSSYFIQEGVLCMVVKRKNKVEEIFALYEVERLIPEPSNNNS